MKQLASLTEQEAETLSAITPEDREAATAAWRTDTAPVATNLLDATEYAGDA